MIKSSVNINIGKLSLIENFSEVNDLSVNEVVVLLLRKILKDGKYSAKKFRAVKYQEVDPDKNWDTLTVYFEDVDYELFTDMRKFFKESVSFLLAKAIDLFLTTILFEVEEILLNYENSDWDICRNDIETGGIWTIMWKNIENNRKNE